MTRPFIQLSYVCFAAILLASGCADNTKSGQRRNSLCRKLHERNRKCVTAMVKALHGQMGDKVPAKVKQKLAKQLGAEITKGEFVGKCQEQAEAKHARAKTLHKALGQCHAKPDCSAYAACFFRAMKMMRKPK